METKKKTPLWRSEFTHNDYKLEDQTTLASSQGFFSLVKHQLKFQLFAGGWSSSVPRFLLKKRHAAAVLLYNPKKDQVVLVEQFRIGAIESDLPSPWILEPVAGVIDAGETAASTAKREAIEEAGCEILELIPICDYLVSSGTSTERTMLYCGLINNDKVNELHGLLHESEDIRTHVFTVTEAFELLDQGIISVASGVIALQWLKLNIIEVKGKWLKGKVC